MPPNPAAPGEMEVDRPAAAPSGEGAVEIISFFCGNFIKNSDPGLKSYYITKLEELQLTVSEKRQNVRRLQAQRNELNAKVQKNIFAFDFLVIIYNN